MCNRADTSQMIKPWLSDIIDGKGIKETAKDFGIALSDGRGFFTDRKGENFIRLPFCALTPGEIEEGIRRLAKAIDSYRK